MPWLFALKGLAEESSAKGKLRTARRGLEDLYSSPQDVYGDWGTFKKTPEGWRMNFDSPFKGDITRLGTSAQELGSRYQDLGSRYRSGFDPYRTQFSNLGGDIAALRGKVTPGMSQLRQAQLNRVEDARLRGRSDLRSQMNLRNISGTPFATSALGGFEAEMGRTAADVEGQSFLQEMAMTQGLIDREAAMGMNAAKMLETALAGESGAFAGEAGALGIEGKMAAAGLEADLNILKQSLGGAENARNFLLDVQKTIADLAVAQAGLMSAQAQGSGQVFGQQGGRLFGRRSNPYATRFGSLYNTRSK